MNLLVDIGNSRLKWGIGKERDIKLGDPIKIDHEYMSEKLFNAWKLLDVPRNLAISSVSSVTSIEPVRQVAKRLWPSIQITLAQTRRQACGVLNAYQRAEQLGIDRWLCLLALKQFHKLPACVVDCGTALTIDLLNERGIHLGGMIAPGLTLMKKSLNQGAHQLQFSEKQYSAGLSDSTEAGIYSGTLFSAVGLIEHVLGNQSANFNLVLTGGDAELLAEYISFELTIEPGLVLQGLSVYLDHDS